MRLFQITCQVFWIESVWLHKFDQQFVNRTMKTLRPGPPPSSVAR